MSNQYLIRDGDSLSLIDTGVSGNARTILRGIASLGLSAHNLQRILITHADADHYGALARLQALAGAQTCTSQPEAEAIRAGRASRNLKASSPLEKVFVRASGPMMRAAPAGVDRLLTPGDVLPVLSGLVVLDSRGHTPGHLSFFLPEKGVLFSGDSVFRRNGSFIPSYGINCWDGQLAVSAMQAQLELAPKIICGGHGVFRLDS